MTDISFGAGQPCDHDQRRQGCAAPERLDLDDGARRGRVMADRRRGRGTDGRYSVDVLAGREVGVTVSAYFVI
jgi:hypothetical protein